MLATTLLLAASASLGLAETVRLIGAAGGGVEYVSPIASDATATTYLIGCPATMAGDDYCYFPEAFKYTTGPETMHFSAVSSGITIDNNCQIATSTPSMVCEINYTGFPEGMSGYLPTTTAITFTGDEYTMLFGVATVVTDSASILNAASAFANDAPVATTAGNSPETTGLNVTPAPTMTPLMTDSTNAEAVETNTSTGGMPQITGSYGWAVGGIAAAAALAAL